MHKKKRTVLITVGVIVIILITLSIYGNSIAENKINTLLKEKLPAHIELSYKDISVNILTGGVSFNNPSLRIKTKDTVYLQTELEMDSFMASGLSYWDYLVSKKIHVGQISFKGLKAIQYKNRSSKVKDTTSKENKPLPPIEIGKINLEKTFITIYDDAKDSTLLSLQNANLTLRKLELNDALKSNLLPFNYESIALETDSVFYRAGDFENVKLRHLLLENQTLTVDDLQYKTKFSKKEYSRKLSIERDYYDVKVAALKVHEIAFGKNENDSVFFNTNLITIDQVNAAFYRDKLIADDLKVKKLYSKSIRELPLKLSVDSISITNSNVEYSEKAHLENPAGVLTISNINAGITNMSNTYLPPVKTVIAVEGVFMKNTPITAEWSFDVTNKSDVFKFEGHAGALKLSDMNSFLSPLVNVELKGLVKETFFVINGNFKESEINLNQNYEEIDLIILNKEKTENKFLSNVANIFISDKSKDEKSEFHKVTAKATRDTTKSFFNYLAKNLKNGLLIMFTSKKDKEKKKKNN